MEASLATESSLARNLCMGAIERVIKATGCEEVLGEGGTPYMVLNQIVPGMPPGEMRVWEGGGIDRMVYIGLDFPPAGLSSHMCFAFGEKESAVPHFTIDSVSMAEFFSFHCDLIPRLDLGTSLGYMDHVYGPLSENWDAVQGLDGVTPAMLSRRQYAIMSPWMLVGRANTDAFNSLFPHVDAFCTRFLDILEDGIPADTYASVSGEQLATRSSENRKLIFNADVDPVWEKIEGMLGPDMCERQREILRGGDL